MRALGHLYIFVMPEYMVGEACLVEAEVEEELCCCDTLQPLMPEDRGSLLLRLLEPDQHD